MLVFIEEKNILTREYSMFFCCYLSFLFLTIELALQHVSMFIRSMNNTYQIVEQLPDLGIMNVLF